MRSVPQLVLLLALVASACSPIELAAPLNLNVGPTVAPSAPLEVVWERNVEGALGPGAPIVTRSFLALGTRRGDVVLVDLESGVLEGASSFGRSIEGGLTLAPDGRRVFIPLASGRRGLIGHDLVEGRRLWEAALGPVQTVPALIGTTVVAAAFDGTVHGLSATTGEVLWSERPDTRASYRASPLVLNDDVVIANDRGDIARRDALTGEIRWHADIGEPVYTTMAASPTRVLVPTTRGTLVGLAAETGERVWSVGLGEGVRVGTPLRVGDLVVVGTSGGDVVGLDLETGATRWRTTVEGVVKARPAAGEGVVYVGTMAKQLVALDLETGAVQWETTLRGRIKTDLTVAGDLLIVATEPRHIVALRTARSPL